MINDIKLFISMLFSPKYKLVGHCNQCGKCCRNIVFYNGTEPITDGDYVENLSKLNKRLRLFYVSGKNENGELLFTCNSLGDDNRCRHYFFRSLYCRKYPLVKSFRNGKFLKTEDYCGYKIVTEKAFKDYL